MKVVMTTLIRTMSTKTKKMKIVEEPNLSKRNTKNVNILMKLSTIRVFWNYCNENINNVKMTNVDDENVKNRREENAVSERTVNEKNDARNGKGRKRKSEQVWRGVVVIVVHCGVVIMTNSGVHNNAVLVACQTVLLVLHEMQ